MAYIQSKGDCGITEEHQQADPVESIEGFQTLRERKDAGVDDGTDRGVVVEGDDRVHLAENQSTVSQLKDVVDGPTLSPCSRIWIMTNREASKATAAHWQIKPKSSKWSSP